MFFIATKLFWAFIQPLNLGVLLLTGGTFLLWTRWKRAGRAILSALVAVALFFIILPVGDWIILPLENRFPPISAGDRVDGIIVLGGASNPLTTADRGQIALGEGAERLTMLTALARSYPEARLVFSGGSGNAFEQMHREADIIPRFLAEQGIDPTRLTIERDSRNTWENALFTLRMVHPDPGERWLLITSATHMPRAIGCFRQAGAELVPYPVDFRTSRRVPLIRMDSRDNIDLVTDGLREWIGLAGYWLTGRIPTIFPAPRPDRSAG